MSSITPKFKFDFSNNIAMLGYTIFRSPYFWKNPFWKNPDDKVHKFLLYAPWISLDLPKDLPEKFNPYYPPKSRSAQYEPSLETLSIESILSPLKGLWVSRGRNYMS